MQSYLKRILFVIVKHTRPASAMTDTDRYPDAHNQHDHWHGNQVLLGRIELERMIVSRVVTQILNPVFLEQARGVVGVGQER